MFDYVTENSGPGRSWDPVGWNVTLWKAAPLPVPCVLWANLYPNPRRMLPRALPGPRACLGMGDRSPATSLNSVERELETVRHWTQASTGWLTAGFPKQPGPGEKMTGLQEKQASRLKVTAEQWPWAKGQCIQREREAVLGLCKPASLLHLPQRACRQGKVQGEEGMVSNSDTNWEEKKTNAYNNMMEGERPGRECTSGCLQASSLDAHFQGALTLSWPFKWCVSIPMTLIFPPPALLP